jgi:O-antigen ligase
MGNEMAGSSLDGAFYLCVIGASLLVASLRGLRWNRLFAANKAILLFYISFAISVCWSGDPAGSFKRLAKDFGLLLVIGIVFSEKDPLQAIRAVFVRCAFVLIPLSVVLVKYFPAYGRDFSIRGDLMVTGVTTQKNSLGEIVLIFTLFLVWDFLETKHTGVRPRWQQIPWDRLILLLMAAWLLHLSQSKTALVCTLLGSFLVLRSNWLCSKAIDRAVLSGALLLPFLVLFSQQFSSAIAPLVTALGRSMTFTGRTDIWAHITINTVNPIIGSGYWNFWGGPGGYAISQTMNTLVPNAHCGYFDLYLDGGMIGLAMLFVLLVVCGFRIVNNLKLRREAKWYVRVRFAVLIAAIIYNLTESTFARMGPIWFTTLMMMVEYPFSVAKARAGASVARKGPSSIDHKAPVLVSRYLAG